MRHLVIAIDGPAASGKSSTAAEVAKRLGLRHVDSGALYRAVTWRALAENAREAPAMITAAERAKLELVAIDDLHFEVRMSGKQIESAIRSDEVTANVSRVSAVPEVRDWVNHLLRGAIGSAGGVMDGRDIGTVVLPDADLKVFLTASAEARARRRLLQRGATLDRKELAQETALLEKRDQLDSTRDVAPLRQAKDARLLETTLMDFEQQVDQIIAWASALG